jgi:hypothetical protein
LKAIEKCGRNKSPELRTRGQVNVREDVVVLDCERMEDTVVCPNKQRGGSLRDFGTAPEHVECLIGNVGMRSGRNRRR